MLDNIRRFRAVRTALQQQIAPEPGLQASKRLLRHLDTLAALVAAVAGSRSVHLPQLALQLPGATHPESRVKRLSRFLQNRFVSYERFFAPWARQLAQRLGAHQPLVVVLDASPLGRGCAVLMASLLYQRRALPLCWQLRRGAKGSFSRADHLALLVQVATLVPASATVIVLGDGEFDAPALQQAIAQRGWFYVLRTSSRTWVDDGFTCCQVRDLVVAECFLAMPGARVTAQGYGPVQAIAWQEAPHRRGLFLVTNLELAQEALRWYQRRFQVETLFSDQKGRGFGLERSHLADPARLSRLLLAVALAYLWLVYLGAEAVKQGWYVLFLRRDRVDLSLFQVGRRALSYLLQHRRRLSVVFVPPPTPWLNCVR